METVPNDSSVKAITSASRPYQTVESLDDYEVTRHRGLTEPKHLMTISVIGAALIDFQVRKNTSARQHLVELTSTAISAGELNESEQFVIRHVLAQAHKNIKQVGHQFEG